MRIAPHSALHYSLTYMLELPGTGTARHGRFLIAAHYTDLLGYLQLAVKAPDWEDGCLTGRETTV